MRGKNVFRCRKTYARKKKKNTPHFPFNILEDKFIIMLSVKDVRKDFSSFQAVKFCPQSWCLWPFYFSKSWMGFAGRKLRQIGGSKKEHDSKVYCSKHSSTQRKERRKMYTALFQRIPMLSSTNIIRLKLGVNYIVWLFGSYFVLMQWVYFIVCCITVMTIFRWQYSDCTPFSCFTVPLWTA